MSKVRRTPYAVFSIEDDYPLDVAALLRGEAPEPEGEILALAALTGQRHRLSRDEFELLRSAPADRWVEVRDTTAIRALVEKGLLVSDTEATVLRERDDALLAQEWNLYAAVYHYMTQWSGVKIPEGEEEPQILKERSRAAAQALVEQSGAPPGAFAQVDGVRELPLPGIERDGALYDALLARRTTRAFDPNAPMALEELDTVLRYVFGCHGYTRNVAGAVCIKRTSPSGGGLHPIEAYPIISNVEGVDPGIYHYNPGSHSLTLLSELESDECRRLATAFMGGQGYFGTAHVAFVLSARFARSHWKYRHHQKAYAGIVMDAAHLSQTLYLVSADLGLGAFVTLAINGRDIEKRLGLDGVSEGVIAMTGCGRRSPEPSPLEPVFTPAEAHTRPSDL